MRGQRCEQLEKGAERPAVDLIRLLHGIDENHHLRNGGVEAQSFNVVAHLPDGFVQQLP